MDRSNFTAALCQHRNNTVAAPGFSCPNPIKRPFDTETDSDPDPGSPPPSPHAQRTSISRPDFVCRVIPGSADVPVGHQFKV
ncbi:MAG: hypothetical protein PHF14_02865 [Verrucomicrobiota bacterium]|nr:hypothetical protein [Verrucomicrobiota bacterium]